MYFLGRQEVKIILVIFLHAVTQLQKSTNWRRERDSNPRWAFGPYSLSRRAPSATRSSLREEANNSRFYRKSKGQGDEMLKNHIIGFCLIVGQQGWFVVALSKIG